ncbi:MAG: AraC family transcriptional regulator [Spirochaetales bacterium]|nr:AraC family transcriptional regulator [Spirochaetales bacterium]
MFSANRKGRRRIFIRSGLAIIILALLLLVCTVADRQWVVLPSRYCWLYPYNDSTSGGSSRITASEADSISFSIDFGSGPEQPFAGVGFGSAPRNLLTFPCDALVIDTAFENVENIDIVLVFGSIRESGRKVRFTATIPVYELAGRTVIPFDSFAIPDWWFEDQHLPVRSVRLKSGLRQFVSAEVIYYGKPGRQAVGTLDYFSFYRSPALMLQLVLQLLLLFLAGTIILVIPAGLDLLRRIRTRRIVIPYWTLGIESEECFWKDRVCPLVDRCSREENVNRQKICDELRISERELARLVRKYADTGFSGFVGSLRIEHACRLLEQTDKTVLSIAVESGFVSLSRFNLLFKRLKGMPPSAFRRSFHAH